MTIEALHAEGESAERPRRKYNTEVTLLLLKAFAILEASLGNAH
jgi:hypothetical protein